jgi:hypothetical protein
MAVIGYLKGDIAKNNLHINNYVRNTF